MDIVEQRLCKSLADAMVSHRMTPERVLSNIRAYVQLGEKNGKAT